MARSRNIKPGFFLNDDLAECEPLARLLFAGLWCIADREGRLEDRPKRIKAEVLPYDNCNVDDLLNQLKDHKFILRYEVDGEKYIQIINFKKHQNPHIKEAPSIIPPPLELETESTDSIIPSSNEQEPAPDEHHTSTVQEPEQNSSFPADSLNLIPDSLNPHTDTNAQKPSPEKIKYADFVSLTNDEYSSLVAKLGDAGAKRCIEILDNYKGATGKKYKSDYRAILNWVVNRYEEEQYKKRDEEKVRGATPVQTTNFKQRTYSDEFYKKIINRF
jgi:hypothetical protein